VKQFARGDVEYRVSAVADVGEEAGARDADAARMRRGQARESAFRDEFRLSYCWRMTASATRRLSSRRILAKRGFLAHVAIPLSLRLPSRPAAASQAGRAAMPGECGRRLRH
jgi:hypothetical protein